MPQLTDGGAIGGCALRLISVKGTKADRARSCTHLAERKEKCACEDWVQIASDTLASRFLLAPAAPPRPVEKKEKV